MKKKKERSVIPTFRELLEDMKPMSFGQKVDHLWTYYKEYLLIAALIVVLVVMTVTSFLNSTKEVLLRGMMVNITITQEGYNYLTEDYFEKIGGEEGTQLVEMDYANFADLADPTNSEDNYSASLKLMARVSGGLLDYALVDQMAFEFYLTQGVYGKLSTLFTQQELEEMGERVIYAMQEEDDERWPVAIDITQTDFIQDAVGEDQKVYFVLSGNQPNLEACRGIWNHIHAWEKKQ